jgi:hypothetical protein
MAEEIIGVKVQVDASDVGKSVGDLRKKIAEAEAQVKQLTKAYGEQSKEAIEAQKTLSQLQTITNQKIEQQNQRIDDAAKTVSALSAAYGGVQGALELTGLAGEDTIKQLAKIQSALAIGDAVQNLAEFRGAITNTFKSFGTSIKTTFSTLRSGLIATGIGAFVVALGLVAANFETVKKVVLNFIPGLGKVADYIGNLVNKITDFIGVTSESGRVTAKLIADNEKAIASTEKFLALNADKYDEFTQRKIKANLEFKKNENEFLNDQKLSEDEKNSYIKQARDKANREIAKSDEDRIRAAKDATKKLSDEQKALADKQEAIRKEEAAARQKILDDSLSAESKAFQLQLQAADNRTKAREEQVKSDEEYLEQQFELENQIQAKQQETSNKKIILDKKTADEEQAILDARTAAQFQFTNAVGGVLSTLSGLFAQGTAASKIAAIAEIGLGTATGFIQGLDIAQKGAKATGPAAPFAFPIFYASQIAAVLGAAGKAKQVLSQVKGGAGGVNIPSSFNGASAPISPSSPNAQLTQLDQTSINQLGSATGRAYVVESDITNQQEKIIRINRAARLG